MFSGGLTVPSPTTVHLTPADLGGRPSPTLLTRLTVVFINTANPFLLKNRAVMEAYDLLAYRPLTEQAYKSVSRMIFVEEKFCRKKIIFVGEKKKVRPTSRSVS